MITKIKSNAKTEFKKGIVTFLDVLGWKGLWQSNKEAVNHLKELVRETRKHANNIVKAYNEKELAKDVRYKAIKIKVLSISDTIVFLSETESIKNVGVSCRTLRMDFGICVTSETSATWSNQLRQVY